MKTSLTPWGNSLALRIPKAFASQLGISAHDPIEISLEKDRLVVFKSAPSLAEMIAQVTDDNIHGETQTGRSVGKEIW